jgi:hypothetical protein
MIEATPVQIGPCTAAFVGSLSHHLAIPTTSLRCLILSKLLSDLFLFRLILESCTENQYSSCVHQYWLSEGSNHHGCGVKPSSGWDPCPKVLSSPGARVLTNLKDSRRPVKPQFSAPPFGPFINKLNWKDAKGAPLPASLAKSNFQSSP